VIVATEIGPRVHRVTIAFLMLLGMFVDSVLYCEAVPFLYSFDNRFGIDAIWFAVLCRQTD